MIRFTLAVVVVVAAVAAVVVARLLAASRAPGGDGRHEDPCARCRRREGVTMALPE
jgi:hypothetical protein